MSFTWRCLITGHMFQNRRDHSWVICSPTLHWLYTVAWLITFSLLLRELFTAEDSPQLTRHIAALLEKGFFFLLPHSLIQPAFLSSQIIHSRAKSQSLSLSFLACLYGSVNLPPRPLCYYPLLSSPFSPSCSWGRGKTHDTCNISWKSGEQSRTEQSVSLLVCMSHAAALKRLREKAIQSGREYSN